MPSVYHVRGQRIRVTPGQKVEWPYDLNAEERALGLNGIREKYIWSALGELGDVTDPNWPSPTTLEKYDQMNRADFWRRRGASSEAVALLSAGGIDDRVEIWSALFMLRNQALNRQVARYFKIRGGTDLLPKAFAIRLSEKIRYATPVVKNRAERTGCQSDVPAGRCLSNLDRRPPHLDIWNDNPAESVSSFRATNSGTREG